MFKHLISLAFFALPLALIAQEGKINQLNDKGQKTGQWIVLDEEGNKRYDGYFLEGHPVGILTRYYPDGVVKAVMNHDSTGRKVDTEIFDEQGKLRAEGLYSDRLKEGKWKYYGTRGNVMIDICYQKDIIHGPGARYFANETIMEKTNWLNGSMDGLQQIFDENGEKTTEIFYREKQMDGAYLAFFPGGRLAVKGKYQQNRKEGEWIYYFPNGETDYSLNYSKGKLLNPEVLDQRQQAVFDKYEKNKDQIKDPLMYRMDPESYFRK